MKHVTKWVYVVLILVAIYQYIGNVADYRIDRKILTFDIFLLPICQL